MKTSAFAAACDCCAVLISTPLPPRLNNEPKAPTRLRLSSVRYPIVTPGDRSSADLDLLTRDKVDLQQSVGSRSMIATEHVSRLALQSLR